MFLRVLAALVLSALTFALTAISFLYAYVYWAGWKYPHSSSMAPLGGFFYGIIIGLLAAIVCFVGVFIWTGKTFPRSSPRSQEISA